LVALEGTYARCSFTPGMRRNPSCFPREPGRVAVNSTLSAARRSADRLDGDRAMGNEIRPCQLNYSTSAIVSATTGAGTADSGERRRNVAAIAIPKIGPHTPTKNPRWYPCVSAMAIDS